MENNGDKFLVTTGELNNGKGVCGGGKVIELSNDMIKSAMFYYSSKASLEVTKFLKKEKYVNITKVIDGVLYFLPEFLMSPTLDGLQEMLDTCEEYANEHNLTFSTNDNPNKSKTKCMAFLKKKKTLTNMTLCGKKLP